MTGNTLFSANLLLAYATYLVGTASPGPSNLAIISTAAHYGRKAALAFSLGVISGSMFWATVAARGVSAALVAWSQFIIAVKIFGGLYLLWLAFKSGRTALSHVDVTTPNTPQTRSLKHFYARGALLHLTNPKAILVWISIVALSASRSGSAQGAVISGCAVIGCIVFSGYAMLFSTDSARRMYSRMRRTMEGCLAIVFGVAGIRLLTSRV
ncbi:LysE family translocator [Paraburkholderia rhizosphaerae]|nr:LysE family translocator [Paraburkholderia rhizosphaerae]